MKHNIIPVILLAFLISSCAASTGSRYSKRETSENKTSKTVKKELKEEFDITPYKTTIDIDDTTSASKQADSENIWYGYPSEQDSAEKFSRISGTEPGFRVLVYTSDVQEQAEYVKSDVYFKSKKTTYLVFEPPFFKVKAGDFTKQSQATEFAFKLNQLGFTEAKVIRDTVNIYK